jgi:hypothetical protein
VFAAALAPLADKGAKAKVRVAPHPAHGTLARVTLSCPNGADRAALEAEAHRLLDPFAIEHEVVWAAPTS